MKVATFLGGVHPRYEKHLTAALPCRPLPAPEELVIPLAQHIGAPAVPVVEKGSAVLVGERIGEAHGFVSAHVHASVSGVVTAVEPRPSAFGTEVLSVVIANDGRDHAAAFDGLGNDWQNATPAALTGRIKAAGIVGLGGAAFPTHVKLSPPPDKHIDTVILNGAECEPYLTADHRVLLERGADVLTGLEIVLRVLGAKRGIVGIEENKADAIAALRPLAGARGLEVLPLTVKYPQGAEKQLIDAALGRRVPSGGLPLDVGVVVQNVGTAAAIKDAVVHGRPLYERIVTVCGAAIKDPANLLVRIGTPARHLIAACGGVVGELGKLIAGGPMMGHAEHTDAFGVTKGTSGLLLLPASAIDTAIPRPCIRCGRCVRACPMALTPNELGTLAGLGATAQAEAEGALDCIECGSCAYECPSRLRLVQQIRLAKAAIHAHRRKQR